MRRARKVLHKVDHVPTRCIAWLEDLLRLPAKAMHATRMISRADLVEAFTGKGGQGPRYAEVPARRGQGHRLAPIGPGEGSCCTTEWSCPNG